MVLFCPLAVAAQDSALKRLETTESGRQWDAVGRLDIKGAGFCTGALIAPDLVLTAAHCMFDKPTKTRIDPGSFEFLAGWRNGRASAYRQVRRAVVHPDYMYDQDVTSSRVRNDLALLELQQPIRNTTVVPFDTSDHPRRGDEVGVVSYALDRADAPSLQEVCKVMARQDGMLIMSCDVDHGSSGAPIFAFAGGRPRIVSVVSAKAEVKGQRVALGTDLAEPLAHLKSQLENGDGFSMPVAPRTNRITVGGARRDIGAKFVSP
ncbi:serine protease [Sedimentitalea sp. XS_ASV28]|uniref:trypsin-like serine peptidase n=1 Tax=Sedimentitalea sp. XS_ASV28 TaxID=3241296 RepID=UPI0035182E74